MYIGHRISSAFRTQNNLRIRIRKLNLLCVEMLGLIQLQFEAESVFQLFSCHDPNFFYMHACVVVYYLKSLSSYGSLYDSKGVCFLTQKSTQCPLPSKCLLIQSSWYTKKLQKKSTISLTKKKKEMFHAETEKLQRIMRSDLVEDVSCNVRVLQSL